MHIAGLVKAIVLGAALACAPAIGVAQDLGGRIADVVGALGTGFPPGEAEGFSEALADAPEGVSGDTLGHLLYARRHFDKAAWFFGADAAADPSDPASLNNFAALIAELHHGDPTRVPAEWLTTARAAAEAAAPMAPAQAAYQNTIGNVALAQGDIRAAVMAFTRASALGADDPLYTANLARALAALGMDNNAVMMLGRATFLAPSGMALRSALADLPQLDAPYRAYLGARCEVDFRCQEVCPPSIIGRIQLVTCEIENASAQMDCEAGKPFATGYDCREEFPDYGILIPGLNAGFSIAVPGFNAHIKVNGDGSVDIRFEGGFGAGALSAYLRADGHYGPSHGASFDDLRGGVRLYILPGGGDAGALAAALGQPAAHLEIEQVQDGEQEVSLETFDAGLLSF